MLPAELGDSDKLRIGQWAIAIGNPFGLDQTVTVGIISATGRTRVGVATYEAFIQTDASINPGNSGGPLLNLDGRVIGVNTAIVSSGQGIGFSIPINMAREVMTQLIAKGRVVRGWLGISIQDLTDDLAAGFGISSKGGVLVADVLKDGPAEAAGMKSGDVIVELGGVPIKEVTDLQKRVAALLPGRAVPLTVLRDRKNSKLTVTLGEQPGEETVVAAGSKGEGLGVTSRRSARRWRRVRAARALRRRGHGRTSAARPRRRHQGRRRPPRGQSPPGRQRLGVQKRGGRAQAGRSCPRPDRADGTRPPVYRPQGSGQALRP